MTRKSLILVSNSMVQGEALQMALKFDVKRFAALNGWMGKGKTRNNATINNLLWLEKIEK